MAEDTDKPVEEKVEEQVVSEAPAPKPRKKKVKKQVPAGHVHIKATFNNTIVTITDPKGNTISSASAGASGFRGSKKGTAYAAQVAMEKAASQAKASNGLSKVDVVIRGLGLGRESAIRTLSNLDLKVESLTDITSIPHGGVRPKKARRV